MVMNEFLDPEILEWFDRCRLEGSMNLLQAEREVLDVHHGEVGGIVAQRWRLPETIVRGIIYHHTPAECGDLICHAVAFSNEIARIVQERSSGQGFGTGLSSASLEVFQIDADNLELLVSDCRARFEEVSGRYNVQ
jgi:HD-like signal output (HDOD) protein